MFSIAAINDVETTQHEWQPLAPTKEAQEFRLTQMYQESLLHMQAGEYEQAQYLLQIIIEDPLSCNAEADKTTSSNPMRQLRFLSFRNLAEAFLKQGASFHTEALQCYLNAVSIDEKDVTLWNRLGTLACSLDSLNIARWAFEQGLHCSPQHWVCMEKLLEVLIAIGDETACLSVVKRLLKISPIHPRALIVKQAIESSGNTADSSEVLDNRSYSVFLRGIDKLEPNHYSLSFSKKRKFEGLDIAEESKQNALQLVLKEASLGELLLKILKVLDKINATACTGINSSAKLSTSFMPENDNETFSDKKFERVSPVVANASIKFVFQDGYDLGLAESSAIIAEGIGLGNRKMSSSEEINFHEMDSNPCVKKEKHYITDSTDSCCDGVVKGRDPSPDEEAPVERRSTRLEKIRTRNLDKNEEQECIQPEGIKNKVSSESLSKLLQPFLICKETLHDSCMQTVDSIEERKAQSSSFMEEENMLCFLKKVTSNSGVYHVAQKLVEEVSFNCIKPFESWDNFLQIEKYLRSASKASSPFYSLFLAEVYMDMTSFLAGSLEMKASLEECDYHLCKILEFVAAVFPSNVSPVDPAVSDDQSSHNCEDDQMDTDTNVSSNKLKGCQRSFWVRYYWVSGRAHYYHQNCEDARADFSKCLRLLQATNDHKNDVIVVDLPHCKVDKEITVEAVQHKLHEVQIQEILLHSAAQMLKNGKFSELIEVLAPIMFSVPSKRGFSFLAGKKHSSDFATELAALNMLTSACEKCEPKNFNVALQSYCQRMCIHLIKAGITKGKDIPDSLVKETGHLAADVTTKDYLKLVIDEVRCVTRFLTDVDQQFSERPASVIVDAERLGCMQQLLLITMCYLLTHQAVQKVSVSDGLEQSEATCLVNAAVSFCRLQHLSSRASIEEQVDLLVEIHDLLAERGLCCAGKACEGGEGVFLKTAIRYFLLLEMKLKSTKPDENVDIVLDTSNSLKEETRNENDCFSTACDDASLGTIEVLEEERRPEEVEAKPLEKRGKRHPWAGCNEEICHLEKTKVDLGLDVALDQSFFCLYGLNLRGGLESSGSQDGLAVHANTSLGDYQTKEQCAEVFQYLLPYARVCTKASLAKLRKVLRAIKQHFPDPPDGVVENNAIDLFLDDEDLDESKLSSMILSHASIKEIVGYAMRNTPHSDGFLADSHIVGDVEGNLPCESQIHEVDKHRMKRSLYQEVYENLYYLLGQVEEGSAGDKWPGFVFTKEGEDFVEQNAKLIKYDLMYNTMRFESWHKLANLFDEEVDLMLNDGSKTCSSLEWQKNANLMKRVEIGRRRTRRCLLMSMALAKTPEQERSVHELLGLVYYDTVQNVAPSFNQRQNTAARDSTWREICQKSLLHFQKALSFRCEWLYFFYLGKLSEKLGESLEVALHYYQEAVESNPSAVDSMYRLHASRLKWLCKRGVNDLDTMKIVAKYCYDAGTQEKVDGLVCQLNSSMDSTKDASQPLLHIFREQVTENGANLVWNTLFEDGLKALEVCIEGELKHFHKARYRLAQSLFARGKEDDVDRAKEELGFCFKSNRSLFIINMWEIDGSTKKNRRKMLGSTVARRSYEIAMPESSRKFITCLRKYLLFYLLLCEKTFDVCTLERAYCSLRADKKFSLCLADMFHVALGKYIHTLGAAIFRFDMGGMIPNLSLKNLLERFFNLFMEHGGSLSDIIAVSLAEAGIDLAAVLSESTIYTYIHRYLLGLEVDNEVNNLEVVNEKIKKRFKAPKLVKEVCGRVCKHAAIAWCRCLCASLSAITPLQIEANAAAELRNDEILQASQDQLVVEIRIEELFANIYNFPGPLEDIKTTEQFRHLSCMAGVRIQQTASENIDKALCLLKQTFVFYRDCTGPFPAGINLFLLQSGSLADDTLVTALPINTLVTSIDISVPRKLLLWAYALVHGHICNIAEAVRFCEDQAKAKARKGLPQGSLQTVLQDKHAVKEATGSGVGIRSSNDDIMEDKERSFSCTANTFIRENVGVGSDISYSNDHILDDKDKLKPEDHDHGSGHSTQVCAPDASAYGLWTTSASAFTDHSTPKEAACRTDAFEFFNP